MTRKSHCHFASRQRDAESLPSIFKEIMNTGKLPPMQEEEGHAAIMQEIRSLERLVEFRLQQLIMQKDDHEKRVRLLEETATRFNFLIYLTMGGGMISLLNLFAVITVIVRETK